TGYYLTLSTTNADGSLTTTSSNTLSTLASTGTFTCTTATASTCSFTTNRWGYKLTQDDATSYIAAPGSDGTKIDEIYTKTNGVTSNLRVGAKVDSSLTAGNYSTTMSFAATAHPTTYGIYYNAGAAGNSASGLPGNQSDALNNASTTTVTLSSDVPTWTGHTFNKWCLGTVTSTAYANDTCSGTEYAAGSDITFDIDEVVSVTLKAMWNINTYSIKYGTVAGISSVTLDGTVCTAAVSGAGCTKTLIYGKDYTLAVTLAAGYSLGSWNATAGEVTVSNNNITYTVGAGNATITPSATLNSYGVTVTFQDGANQVVFTNASDNTDIVTATSASSTVQLKYGTAYTATMSLSENYEFDSWTAGTNINVSNTTTNPTTVTLTGAGAGALTATGKSSALSLYDTIAAMTKGTQTAAQLQESISASNSGVYTYNSSVFGAASDAANTSTIYYYRGILDNTTGSYGSDGDGAAYPNYVKLDNNTCWRILRTTGSGGVKMIYNGTWTGSTCANAGTNAELTTAPFNTSSATVAGTSYTGLQYKNMHAVGYTYSNVAASTTSATALSTLFGSSGNDTTTNTNSSIIKKYIESWYSSNMTSYTSHLEANAGYCADRTTYPDGSYALSSKLAESTTVIPYGTSSMTIYRYGAYARNYNSAQTPTLGCPRGIVDTYSTTTASGGNGQLTYPVALITADEASFAGSGSSTATNGSSYNANSFLRSGSSFWLLSPYFRDSVGYASVFFLGSNGYLGGNGVNSAYGVRPAISLASGTMISGGDGTAASPWTVTW
ncbi:hypothetical protein IJF85_00590, partial [Candidatus Saccharibacteria bacterium]|nr:hypothetical protein [Candidatus Saccharibacteria bacterium]